MKTKHVNSVIVTTQELASNLALKSDSDSTSWEVYESAAKALFFGNMDRIRKAFREGMTVMLLPEEVFNFFVPYTEGKTEEQISDAVELRVVHNGVTIGVILAKELRY